MTGQHFCIGSVLASLVVVSCSPAATSRVAAAEARGFPSGMQTCRVYSTAETRTTTSSTRTQSGAPYSATDSQTCEYDKSSNELTCRLSHSNNLPFSWNAVVVAKYDSLGDFVDEVSVIPPLARPKTVTTKYTPSGPGMQDNTMVFSYDAQRRLIRSVQSIGSRAAQTFTYTAWDASGRPTALTSSVGFGLTYAYDDAARTQTITNTNGGVLIQTYDANGNFIESNGSPGGGVTSKTIHKIDATGKVCR